MLSPLTPSGALTKRHACGSNMIRNYLKKMIFVFQKWIPGTTYAQTRVRLLIKGHMGL
jgi:hypothetical protein